MATPSENNAHQPVLPSTQVSRKRKQEGAEGNSMRKANTVGKHGFMKLLGENLETHA